MTPLSEFICTQLQEQKAMPFVDFMQMALYHPLHGYYNAGLETFGRFGDFITAPELSALFGQTLAKFCMHIFPSLPEPLIFEFGAGTGRLCIDILAFLEKENALPRAYYILEPSQALRQRQEELIQKNIPHLSSYIHWCTEWPSEKLNAVVIANEVLDAMPVFRFLKTKDALLESYICLNEHNELIETFKPCKNSRLSSYIKKVLPETFGPYQSEANLFIPGWIKQCSDMLHSGVILIIDYGFPRHEYYHEERSQGSLMCHYHHKAHTNPLLNIGEQDISAHVDFTQVAEAADEANLEVAGFTNQAAFLLENGLLDLLAAIADETSRLKATQAVKQLICASEMGELFKVMALTKQINNTLTGFQLNDKRVSL